MPGLFSCPHPLTTRQETPMDLDAKANDAPVGAPKQQPVPALRATHSNRLPLAQRHPTPINLLPEARIP
ncbi:hypothetical protein SAMN05421799_1132 [Alicyclobacillus vulcanalis]|uniref:Uncharacterized protein n=1 Tax=Alicyclobacillus vulcanalis TaxID=252246 RepID=A0A1N7PEE6_9BACL|nr:hypothetical protein SAMN05421799_1132 [Alicyclobacillus vulcanalis]